MPQLKLIFDTGRCPRRAPYQQTVLLSHAHMDHVGGLHFHVSTRYSPSIKPEVTWYGDHTAFVVTTQCNMTAPHRGMLGLPPSVVVLPEAVHEPTQQLLRAFEALDGGALECSFVPLSPG